MESRTPDPQVAIAPAPESRKLAFSVDEFAEVTSLKRSFIYEEIRSGRLIARKAGARTLITHFDGEAYLASLPTAGTTLDAVA